MVYCRDENRHCAIKSKGIRVRFPCIPLYDRVSSSRRRLGQYDSYAQERQLDENKVRGEKAKKDLEKNLQVVGGIVGKSLAAFETAYAQCTV